MKLLKCFIFAFFITISFCSCDKTSNNTSLSDSNSQTEINSTSITAHISILESIPENEIAAYNQTALEFLQALADKDSNAFGQMLCTRSEGVFDFINDVEIDNFDYVLNKTESSYNNAIYDVRLNISKSKSNIFLVGESDWQLCISFGAANAISYFKPIDSKLFLNNEKDTELTMFCYAFSNEYFSFETLNDFNEIVPDIDNFDAYDDFIHSCIHVWSQYKKEYQAISISVLATYMENKFGIKDIDFAKSTYYNSIDKTLACPGHGGTWLFCNIVSSEFDEQSNSSTVIIDYYADCALLVKAKTVKYIVEGKLKDNYKLISTELIYDSGFMPAHGSV